MGSLAPPLNLIRSWRPPRPFSPAFPAQSFVVASRLSCSQSRFPPANPLHRRCRFRLRLSVSNFREEEASESSLVQELRVPEAWLAPTRAHAESVWLRRALHEWLDEEYCPEPANFEISRLAAQSYYESLTSSETDLGEILLEMARRLKTLSFRESFHGPYSSANAAVHLITQRMNSTAER